MVALGSTLLLFGAVIALGVGIDRVSRKLPDVFVAIFGRTQRSWPSGVQEDDDLRWDWRGPAAGR